MSSRPLSGTRVIEVCSYISGPFAAMILGDLGAEVIKVERPDSGDPFRAWDTTGQNSPTFAAYNRGKRSVAIDLKSAAGQKALLKLAKSADVLIENFRPGTLDRLGVGYSAIHEVNSRLVYCSITGLGSTGPSAQRPFYDAIAQAMSGLWSLLTDMGDPKPVGPPLADQLTGLYAANGVLAALCSGRGQKLEVSMLAASMAFTTPSIAYFLLEGTIDSFESRPRRSQSYSFLAKDGLPFAIHLSSPQKFWEGLVAAVGKPHLLNDPRFKTKKDREANYVALREVLGGEFGTRTRAEWLSELERQDVPSAPIYNIAEALGSPEGQRTGIRRAFGHGDRRIELAASPVAFDGPVADDDLPPPRLGEHTSELLG